MKRLVRMMVAFVLTGAVSMSAGMMGYASDAADTEEKIATLESEKADLEERVTQLESENAALQEQIDALQNPETEVQTEPSTGHDTAILENICEPVRHIGIAAAQGIAPELAELVDFLIEIVEVQLCVFYAAERVGLVVAVGGFEVYGATGCGHEGGQENNG